MMLRLRDFLANGGKLRAARWGVRYLYHAAFMAPRRCAERSTPLTAGLGVRRGRGFRALGIGGRPGGWSGHCVARRQRRRRH